jgi:hypothetical protein
MGLFDGSIIEKGKNFLENIFCINEDEQLDEKFSTITEMFNQLDLEHDGKNGIIHENTLDTLYHSVTGKQSAIDFSNEYGGTDKQINTIDEFTQILLYLESLSDKDVFKLVKSATKTIDGVSITSPVPQEIVDKFKLDNSTGFYHKLAYADGLPILASSNGTDKNIVATSKIVTDLLDNHPQILEKLIETDQRIILLDFPNEKINTIPELTELYKDNTDEELNHFGYRDVPNQPGGVVVTNHEPYYITHELAHAVGMTVLPLLYPEFNGELNTLYTKLVTDQKLFKDKYASTNPQEFWAEIASYYYGKKDDMSSDDFKNYAPEAYNLVHKYFGEPTKTPAVIPV